VNNMFSKAAIWVVILLVLFMLFKQFDSHGISTGATQVAYSDFLDEVNTKQIKDATLEGATVVATTQEGKKIKATLTGMDHG
jgi:cell division protease FtsH